MCARIQPCSAVHLLRFVYKVGGIIKSNDRRKKIILGSRNMVFSIYSSGSMKS